MEKEKIKIEIKNRWTGSVLFEYEKEGNTIKDTVNEAVKRGAYLRDANLRGAYLRDANLGDANLRGANLGGANLRGAYLGGADLRGAYLGGAYLGDADLRGAYLRDANLGDANLRGANLGGANLRGAYLGGADLRGAYLGDANLGDANLGDAYLRDANLGDAKNVPFIPMICPSDGSFIGWKKVIDGDYTFLVKLLIPEDAKRSSATGRKCRCSKAVVMEITDLNDMERKVESCTNLSYNQETVYKVGEEVLPDSFDEDRWNECSHGIHFFINKQEAIDYDV